MKPFHINSPSNLIPTNTTTEIMQQSTAYEYHNTLSNYQLTPLISLRHLASKYGVGNIYVKDEAPRLGLNAFKGLGASYAISEVIKENSNIEVFCTATDGNHGRAVAWAAVSAGRKAVVFVPKDTTSNRIEAIVKEGAEVIQLDKNYDQTCAYAEAKSENEGWQLIQDTAWQNYETIPARIMAGYLTQFHELEDSLHKLPSPQVDMVFLQAGVGSWAGSAIWYYLNRYGQNRPKIVVVEPYESAGILASFNAGRRVCPSGTYETIMAGLNCGIPSSTAWEIIENGTDAAIKVKDKYAQEAMRALYYPIEDDQQIIAGESGVGGLAGFMAIMTNSDFSPLKEQLQITNQTNILFYNTEGATDIDSFNRIVHDTSDV